MELQISYCICTKVQTTGVLQGYCVDTAGKNTSRIAEYIKDRRKEDEPVEQLTMRGISPFKGGT